MRELIKSIVPIKYRIGGLIDKILNDGVVVSGLFKGMKLLPGIVGSSSMPKIMGTYENELSGIFKDFVISGNYKKVIDIGAAEGYYAVGLAVANPELEVIAYEIQPKGQELIKNTALVNHVSERLIIKGECTPNLLRNDIDSNTFILIDVEGYEDTLLDPIACPELLKADILVEIHDYISSEIAKKIQDRFYLTHHLTVIHSEKRTHLDFPIHISYFKKIIFKLSGQNYVKLTQKVVHERKRSMRWFYLTRKEQEYK